MSRKAPARSLSLGWTPRSTEIAGPPERAAEAMARVQQQRVVLGLESDAQRIRRLGYITRAEVQAKRLKDEAAARAMAEEQEEYEREQAEEDAARQEIEDAIAEAEYGSLSEDELKYLEYGGF